jgi:thiol-disulfide isomerase/thioredoxin
VTLLARLGLALVRPRTALAIAGDRRHAGRSGSDLLIALVALIAATTLHTVVAAVWLGGAVDAMLGVRGVVHVVTGALTLDFATLVVTAVILWAAGRRDMGRAFDLACVVVLPLVAVDLVARVAVGVLDVSVSPAAMWATTVLAFGWTGALVALAVPQARLGGTGATAGEGELRLARRAGWAAAAIVAIGVVHQIGWITRHPDQVAPLTVGAKAPALALPRVGPHGELGEPVGLPAGKPVVVDFWATWCQPCLASLPHLDAFAKRHPEVAVLAIDLDDPAEARKLFEARGYTLDLLADDGTTSERWGVTTIPHTVVIDRSGHVRRVGRGGGIDLEAEVR